MNKQILFELKLYIENNRTEDTIIREIGSRYDYRMPIKSMRTDMPQKSDELLKDTKQDEYLWLERFRKKTVFKADEKKYSSCRADEEELEEYINKAKTDDTFSTKLLRYIDRSGLKDAEIYKKAGIDRRHFSKIRCDKYYQPRKTTAISLCIALELTLEETEELLQLAGYSLSNSDIGDLVVKFYIERKIYDLTAVNEALDYFGQRLLGVVG